MFGLRFRWLSGGICVLLVAAVAPRGSADHLRRLQQEADTQGKAAWGHWGVHPNVYASWATHSNRLIPVYTFGLSLDPYQGANSIYRDARRLQKLYGRVPPGTLNPKAEYFDQTDLYRLQQAAAKAGKKYIFVVVFDGMDWTTTLAAATYCRGEFCYSQGRGTGLYFQDYRGTSTDFGFCVTSPAMGTAQFQVDWQVATQAPTLPTGGYDPIRGGDTPWSRQVDFRYLIGRERQNGHVVTDSAASGTSIFSGVKTYNDSVSVLPGGEQTEPVARALQKQGFAVGVVTSVPISHATPAAAYANNVSRDDYQDLTRDLLGIPSVSHRREPLPGVDVLIGGGWGVTAETDSGQGTNFVPGNVYLDDGTRAKVDVENGGRYLVAERSQGKKGSELLAARAREAAERSLRLLGLFGVAEGNLPFQTADGNYDPYLDPVKRAARAVWLKRNPLSEMYSPADVEENPTLADCAQAALTVLEKQSRFWLLVEAGDVDWAMHSNNLDSAIGAIRSGDEAFRTIVNWIEARDAWEESAVIVTADHGHLLVLTHPEVLAGPEESERAQAARQQARTR